jgi:hypothetical protein
VLYRATAEYLVVREVRSTYCWSLIKGSEVGRRVAGFPLLEVDFLANGEGGFPLWANRDSVCPAHWGGADAAARAIEDLFRSRLDQIINMKHALVRLGGQIDWRLIGDKLGEV